MVFPAVFRRVCLCVWAAVLVGALPRVAAADDLRADFDRDGVTDVVTLDPVSTSLLHVWLSTTQTARELRTSRPIYRMVAVDLDGDGRPELVVSDTHATLHVWRHAGNGRLRPVRPHASARTSAKRATARSLHRGSRAVGYRDSDARSARPFSIRSLGTPHTAPLTLRGQAPATAVASFDCPASPWSSRAPPFA